MCKFAQGNIAGTWLLSVVAVTEVPQYGGKPGQDDRLWSQTGEQHKSNLAKTQSGLPRRLLRVRAA